MRIDLKDTRIFIKPGPTDLRTSLDALVNYAEVILKQDPYSGAVFLFCNRQKKILKAITFDKTGFWIAQKRLQKQTWKWPDTSYEVTEIKPKQVLQLLNGIDFTSKRY